MEVLKVETRRYKSRPQKLVLEGYGSYLGRGEGCFEIRAKDEKGKYVTIETYPLYKGNIISEAILKDNTLVSTSALTSLAIWNIDTTVTDRRGMPIAVLLNIDNYSHVKTRLCQYEAVHSEKALIIAKQIILSKYEGYKRILEKYELKQYNGDVEKSVSKIGAESYRNKLMAVESKFTRHYFSQVFSLFPKKIRPESRKTYKAPDGVNNVFNLGYLVLRWRMQRALINAKLEPYLGYLHSTQFGKPSLVCDFQDLYRYLIDDLLIQRCVKLRKKDFIMRTEFWEKLRGRRIFLREIETHGLFEDLEEFFDKGIVEIPRIKVGKRQTIQTLINEEAQLFAMYFRGERKTWIPRIPSI
jgi:CRISPR-associated protein Cas1